jgi:hypothetical protein
MSRLHTLNAKKQYGNSVSGKDHNDSVHFRTSRRPEAGDVSWVIVGLGGCTIDMFTEYCSDWRGLSKGTGNKTVSLTTLPQAPNTASIVVPNQDITHKETITITTIVGRFQSGDQVAAMGPQTIRKYVCGRDEDALQPAAPKCAACVSYAWHCPGRLQLLSNIRSCASMSNARVHRETIPVGIASRSWYALCRRVLHIN